MDLHAWGWTPELQAHFDRLDAPGLVPARVARHDRTGQLVVHATGEAFARIPGHLRRAPPAVGDWVALDPTDPPTIRALLPRRTALSRAAPGRETAEQVVAANLDVVFVVAALDAPVNERRIERTLVVAAGAGIRAVVVLNKADAADRAPADAPHADVTIVTSALNGLGMDAIRALVPPGTTAAFVGPSGVGKSSLVNALLGREALPTQEVRASDHKGRHTTTARHLLPVPGGGVVLDTPGMRELGLWDAVEGVSSVFADVEALAARCRFRDCAHETEPGCAVRDEIAPERLASWRKLQREAAHAARKADVAKERAEGRAWGKMARDVVRAKRDRFS